MAFGLSSAAVGLLAAGTGAAVGIYSANKSASAMKDASAANAQDPRIKEMLYGSGDGSTGLLAQYQALGQTPQSDGLKTYGQGADSYLNNWSSGELQGMRNVATNLANSNAAAPRAEQNYIGAPVWAKGNMVNAPSQNDIDLSGSYNSFVNGEAGANPYLTGAIGKGINQSNNAFGAMQRDSTKNLLENVMPSIRSNSVIAGQYGGSRQGLAEGKALDSFITEQQRAMSQVGQNNTDAAVAAQAGAYDSDRNRQLAATQGLGAQQYGVASQDAQTKNQAEFMNVDRVADYQKTQAAMNQQVGLANMGAQQQTNQLNSANQVAGLGAQQGLLGMTLGAAQGQDNYAINKASQVGGLLQPYLGQPGAQVQPTFNNSGAGALGGAAAGLGLYNQFKQSSTASPPPSTTSNPFAGYGW